MNHLNRDHICPLALRLSDDVYGANGDFDDLKIEERLIENIHDYTNYRYKDGGVIPVYHVASLIRAVWEYMDRSLMGEIARDQTQEMPSVQEMGKIIAAKAHARANE